MPATTVSTLIYKIVWDDGDARKKADAWDRKLKQSAKQANLLAQAFVKLSTGLASFTIDAVKNFALFEDSLGHARRTMGLSREETLQLGDALMDLSTSFEEGGLAAGVSANELARISGILGQLGFNARDNTEQFQELVSVVAKVGVAFGMSAQKAAEGLGILRNLYDLPVENIENAASSIAHLGNTTVATAGQIVDIMQRMGGIAGLLGVSAQEAAAFAATLRESGVRTQVAGTAMSQIFSRLASDVDRFGEALKMGAWDKYMLRWNIENNKAADSLKMVLQALQNIQAREGKIAATQALKDLGLTGVRVQQALLALSNNLGGLNKNLAESDKGFAENIAVNEVYQAAIDNTAKKWEQFKNLIDIIAKLIGKDLAMAFSNFLDNHLIPFTEDVKEWLKTSEGAKAIFGKDGLIAKGLDWIGTKLFENKEAFFEWLDTLNQKIPAAIEHLRKKWDEFYIKHLKASHDWFLTNWKDIVVGFVDTAMTIQDILDVIGKIPIAIKTAGSVFTEVLGRIIEGVTKLAFELNKMLQAGIQTFKEMSGWIRTAADLMSPLTGKVVDASKEILNLGKEAYGESVFPDMVSWIDKANMSLSDMESRLSRNLALMQKPGLFIGNAQGLLGLSQENRILGRELAFQTPTPQTPQGTPMEGEQLQQQVQQLNVTLQMNDQEVGRMNTILQDRQQQENRRTLGGRSR